MFIETGRENCAYQCNFEKTGCFKYREDDGQPCDDDLVLCDGNVLAWCEEGKRVSIDCILYDGVCVSFGNSGGTCADAPRAHYIKKRFNPNNAVMNATRHGMAAPSVPREKWIPSAANTTVEHIRFICSVSKKAIKPPGNMSWLIVKPMPLMSAPRGVTEIERHAKKFLTLRVMSVKKARLRVRASKGMPQAAAIPIISWALTAMQMPMEAAMFPKNLASPIVYRHVAKKQRSSAFVPLTRAMASTFTKTSVNPSMTDSTNSRNSSSSALENATLTIRIALTNPL